VYFLQRNRRSYKKKKSSKCEVKAGHSKEFERRRRAYKKCERDWKLDWKYKVYTPTRMLIGTSVLTLCLNIPSPTNAEGLVHEEFCRCKAPAVRCSCVRCHREFFDYVGVGGVVGMVDSAVSWMKLLGQVAVVEQIK
jgi:hypothetical protein